MAKFTKQVEFRAFQFNPDELKGMNDYAIEDVIVKALDWDAGIKSAFVNEHGNLDVVFYTYSSTKEWFVLTPGDWIAVDGAGFAVVADEDFKKFATPVD